MINVSQLKSIFTDKLAKTGSFDEAFTKAVWVAYNLGIEDGKKLYEKVHEAEQPKVIN